MPRGKERPVCEIDGCESPNKARGMCSKHYMNWKRTGDPLTQKRAPNGSGHVCKTHGYRFVFREGKQVAEHRDVAERMLGRSLDHKEVVHHVNGDKLDNRPENLEILASQSDHAKEHYESGEFLPRNSRAQKICSVPGCGRKHRSLGLCLNHYMAKRRGKNKPVSKLVEEAKELLALYEPEALK